MKTIFLLFFGILVFGCCSVTDSSYDASYYQEQTSPQVVINGKSMTIYEKQAFQNFYGVAPSPGNYWYDSTSGLYGRIGESAAGFIFPGHDFGVMKFDASNGNSGVYLNGRELQSSEAQYFLSFLGTSNTGYYYLDSYGNLGMQGYPSVNIFSSASEDYSDSVGEYYADDSYYYDDPYYYDDSYYTDDYYYGDSYDYWAGSEDYYGGMGYDWGDGGGDNFWSSSYGAGNSDGGCTYINAGGSFVTSGCG